MRITYEGWDPVDRQRVCGTLAGLDRAQTQAADLVTLELSSLAGAAAAAAAGAADAEAAAAAAPAGGTAPAAAAAAAAAARSARVIIKQNPAALRPDGVGGVRVGACAWDGAFVLAAYLDAQPPGAFAGLRAVELGAGQALPGLVLARLGAAVYLTDKPAATVFGRVNAGKNGLLLQQQQAQPQPRPQQPQQPRAQPHQLQPQPQQLPRQLPQQQAPAPGSVVVLGLDWEDRPDAAAAAAAITASGPVDLIVGTDCIYPDPNGRASDSSGLLAAVCALATPGRTRALLSFEARAEAAVLRAALLDAAAAAPLACRVQRLPPEALPQAYAVPHIELYELAF